jgi:hypothetical protein
VKYPWRLPAQSADRRLGIRNAKEFGDAARDESLDRAFLRCHNRARLLIRRLIRPGGHSGPCSEEHCECGGKPETGARRR